MFLLKYLESTTQFDYMTCSTRIRFTLFSWAYKFLKIKIENANIHNISRFIVDFSELFFSIIGEMAFNLVFISKYSMSNGSIDQEVVVVSFKVPLCYEYLNTFSFPINWHFFEYIERPMYSQRQRNALQPRNTTKNSEGKFSKRREGEFTKRGIKVQQQRYPLRTIEKSQAFKKMRHRNNAQK